MASINLRALGKSFNSEGYDENASDVNNGSNNTFSYDAEDYRFMQSGRVVIKDHRGHSIIYGKIFESHLPCDNLISVIKIRQMKI